MVATGNHSLSNAPYRLRKNASTFADTLSLYGWEILFGLTGQPSRFLGEGMQSKAFQITSKRFVLKPRALGCIDDKQPELFFFGLKQDSMQRLIGFDDCGFLFESSVTF